jgi:hypothetical protein
MFARSCILEILICDGEYLTRYFYVNASSTAKEAKVDNNTLYRKMRRHSEAKVVDSEPG